MEFKINTDVLRGVLQNVISVIDRSYTKPILSNFMIRTLEDEDNQNEDQASLNDYLYKEVLCDFNPNDLRENDTKFNKFLSVKYWDKLISILNF